MANKGIKFKDNSGNNIYPCPYYPVGSIYMSVNNVNPASFFGGTWERLKSRFLLGADDSTYKLGATGGSTTHAHSTGNHILTIEEMPSHDHYQNLYVLSHTVSPRNKWFYLERTCSRSKFERFKNWWRTST